MIAKHLQTPENTWREEFKKLYNAYSGRIYNYALGLSHDSYLAEEILQAVFIQLWENRQSLRSPDRMLQYLYTSAKNTFLNYCKHELTQRVYEQYMLEHFEETSNEDVEKQEAQSLELFIKNIVHAMPPVRQKVFLMSRYKGMAYKEIAEQLGISERTVETHITLAMKQIKEKLDKG